MKIYNDFSELPGAGGNESEATSTFGDFNEVQNMAIDNMSPKFSSIPQYKGNTFFIGMREVQHGGVLEPAHTHIKIPEGEAKFWLADGPNKDQVSLADGGRVSPHITNDIKKHLQKNRKAAVRDWNSWVDDNYPQFVTHKLPDK